VFRHEPGTGAFPDDAVPVFGLSPRETAVLCGTHLLSFPSHVVSMLDGAHTACDTCVVGVCPSLASLSPWDMRALEAALGICTDTWKAATPAHEIADRVQAVRWRFLRLEAARLWPAPAPGLTPVEVDTLVQATARGDLRLKPCTAPFSFPCQDFLFSLITLGKKNEWELATLLMGMAVAVLQHNASMPTPTPTRK
jgi:hypothetical protein